MDRRGVFTCIFLAALVPSGCGHDWSAADTSDVSAADEAADAIDADSRSDEGVEDGGLDDDGTDVPREGEFEFEGGDEATPDATSCDPTLEFCEDGWLHRCASDGSGWEDIACDFGCALEEVRCLRLVPANVHDDTLLDQGLVSLVFSPGTPAVFDTDTGAIRLHPTDGRAPIELRPPGVGTIAGIPFVVQEQELGAPGLGIWVLAGFVVEHRATVYGTGSNAMVLLVGGDVSIDGFIDVGGLPADLGASLGPGANAGGHAERPGEGSGGGRPGRSAVMLTESSGGGGGGYGGSGRAGGDTMTNRGGAGGAPWGNVELSPLVGGSGGGGGGGDREAGGRGGAGGGALQISCAGRISIGPEGGITAGGRGGQGGQVDGTARGGGGGGGSGGAVLLEAAWIGIAGGIACNGGGGGAGAPGEVLAGANGADGTLTASAGATGGEADGEGAAGGAGSAGAVINGELGGDTELLSLNQAGGGGGGAGRIRLNAPALTVDGFLSPAEATGLATRGSCATR